MRTNGKTFCFIMALLSLAAGATGQTPATLVNFNGANGANPQASLLAAGGTLFGTTYTGGISNAGTVFAVTTNGGGFTNVYSFTGGSDGRGPQAALVIAGMTLYGTTESGGAYGNGNVFAVNTNGSGITNIYSFIGGPDGAEPEAGLVLMSNTLYGTTYFGGPAGYGSVFRVNTNGSDFTNIYSFTNGSDGANPEAGLVLAGGTLYGTANGGGAGYGTVFRVNTDGSSFSNIYSFTGGSDGANPQAPLVLAGGTLYGTANGGGSFENGTVFSVKTNGSGFQSYEFNYDDGANPRAGLVLSGGTLYGTATNGGSTGWGTVFQVNTNGSGFTSIYTFSNGSDGAVPEAGLVLLGNTLYGTTQADNGYGSGTVFALNVPGTGIPLNIALNAGQVTLSWSSAAFSLQFSTNVNGVYATVTNAASPYTTNITGKKQFFRLQEN